MDYGFPNIKDLNICEAISWYTKQVAEITNVKNRVNGTFSEEYKEALLQWKKELNRKASIERNKLRNCL